MTDTFRALCAELLDGIELDVAHVQDPDRFQALLACAREALAQPEPVGPSIPAAITDMPEQQQRWYALGWRAALARYGRPASQPEPVGPTDEELDELFTEIDQSGECLSWRAFARAVLQRWGRPAITPIPPDRVPLPQNEEQAAGMANIGLAWLKQHSSDRLRHPGLAPPL